MVQVLVTGITGGNRTICPSTGLLHWYLSSHRHSTIPGRKLLCHTLLRSAGMKWNLAEITSLFIWRPKHLFSLPISLERNASSNHCALMSTFKLSLKRGFCSVFHLFTGLVYSFHYCKGHISLFKGLFLIMSYGNFI